MGKAKAPRRLADNEARAVLRTLRISPQKLNLVAAVDPRHEGRRRRSTSCEFSQQAHRQGRAEGLKSAIANAENNHGLDVDALVVAEAYVGKNIVMKRMHARARGRGVRIEKLFSQLTIVLRERRSSPKKRRPPDGSESQSDRASPRHQPHLGFALVRERGEYGKLLHEDIKIRKYLREEAEQAAGISKIIIERPQKKCRVTIHAARPASVIGKKGADIEKLRKELARMAPGAKCT